MATGARTPTPLYMRHILIYRISYLLPDQIPTTKQSYLLYTSVCEYMREVMFFPEAYFHSSIFSVFLNLGLGYVKFS